MNSNAAKPERWILTQSKENIAKCTWTINNFSYLNKVSSQTIVSPTFSSPSNSDIQFKAVFYPNGFNRDDKFSMRARLTTDSEIYAKFKACILNSYPERSKVYQSQEAQFIKLNEALDINGIMKLADLMEINSGFLAEDNLKIVCEVSFISDISNISGIDQFKIPECKIAEDFGNLLDNHKFSDVTIVAGEHEIPVHKAILAARSDVFAAMFESEMKETKLNTVTITDIDCDVLQEMLRFIYTGGAPKLKQMAKQLLAAADKYALTKLKAMSEEAVFAEISIENAMEILSLADLYGAEKLAEKTTNFINAYGGEIVKTDGWQNMKKIHSYLAVDLYEALHIE